MFLYLIRQKSPSVPRPLSLFLMKGEKRKARSQQKHAKRNRPDRPDGHKLKDRSAVSASPSPYLSTHPTSSIENKDGSSIKDCGESIIMFREFALLFAAVIYGRYGRRCQNKIEPMR
jgi:hypothetical protein